MAQAAFIFPLPHTRHVPRRRCRSCPSRRTRRRGLARRRVERLPACPDALPSAVLSPGGGRRRPAAACASCCPTTRTRRGGGGKPAFPAAAPRRRRRSRRARATYHRFWFRDAAYSCLAASTGTAFTREAAEVLRVVPGPPARRRVLLQPAPGVGRATAPRCGRWPSTGASPATRAVLELTTPAVARGARWIERKRTPAGAGAIRSSAGLLPASVSAEHLGPFDYFYWDDFWALAGLRDGAGLLSAAGDDAAAGRARRCGRLPAGRRRGVARADRRHGSARGAIPAGPRRRIDPAHHRFPRGVRAARAARRRRPQRRRDRRDRPRPVLLRRRVLPGRSATRGSARISRCSWPSVELAAGDRRALDRLRWLLERGHVRRGRGPRRSTRSSVAVAWATVTTAGRRPTSSSFVRNMLVREIATRGGGPRAVLDDPRRLGRSGASRCTTRPTHYGTMSFAVRWHGDRPALLWELDAPWRRDRCAAHRARSRPGLVLDGFGRRRGARRASGTA